MKSKPIKLRLRPNIQQFLILVLVNAFVGTMIGLEQTVVLEYLLCMLYGVKLGAGN